MDVGMIEAPCTPLFPRSPQASQVKWRGPTAGLSAFDSLRKEQNFNFRFHLRPERMCPPPVRPSQCVRVGGVPPWIKCVTGHSSLSSYWFKNLWISISVPQYAFTARCKENFILNCETSCNQEYCFFYWNPGKPRTLLQLKLLGILPINLFLT
jgi:hypothetical protein